MTAETLKPFITPTSVANGFPAKQSSVTHSKHKARQLIPIVLSVVALVLVGCILMLTIWQKMHVQQLDRDLSDLRQEVFLLRQRLGINYLDEMVEFQKEYTNLDDFEGEEDEDEEDDDFDNYSEDEDDEDAGSERAAYDDYLDMIEKEKASTQMTPQNNNAETETDDSTSSTSSAASNDDFFGDFTSYNESKKKKARKSRSIAVMRNELQTNDVAQTTNNQIRTDQQLNESGVIPDVATTQQQPRKQHQRSRQGRQRILVRKGESPVSVKSADLYAGNGHTDAAKPAAHFHLNRKVPHHNAPIQLDSYQGDMYVGHATASSDNPWQQHFNVNNGVLTVNQPGLYYVYAQICYNNTHDYNGFIIFHGHNAFLQCLNTVPTNMPQKLHTCHTSGLIKLQKHESIHLRDIHRDRNVMLRDANNRSYFGIIKI